MINGMVTIYHKAKRVDVGAGFQMEVWLEIFPVGNIGNKYGSFLSIMLSKGIGWHIACIPATFGFYPRLYKRCPASSSPLKK